MRWLRGLRQGWLARRFELAKGQLGELDVEPTIDDLHVRRPLLGGSRAKTTTEWRGD